MKPIAPCLAVIVLALVSACVSPPERAAGRAQLAQQVTEHERAFARTMADRDHAAFTRFVSEEGVFFTGPAPSHGRQEVAVAWQRFFEGAAAPFSWEPDQVEVLASGTLASSSGPVRDPAGKIIARFHSVWRLEAPGTWRVIFDTGSPVCDCAKP